MPKKIIEVDIPINSPSEMELLCDAIIAQDTQLGLQSPVKQYVSQEFKDRVQLEKDKRSIAKVMHADAQSYTEEANFALGIATTQNVNTEGTIYYVLNKFRDILLLKYENHEEKISAFGFNVVKGKVKGRATVRVDIPIKKPYEIERLCTTLIEKDTALGVDSPFSDGDITTLTTQLNLEKTNRRLASKYHEDGQGATEEANTALGTGVEQNVKTTGTIYNIVVNIKKALLIEYRNHEEALSIWGFKVVIGQAHMPGYHFEEIRNINLNAGQVYFMPVDNLNGKVIFKVQNTGNAQVQLILVENQEDDPAGILPVIEIGQTKEYLLSDHELGKFTIANFLWLKNTSEENNTTLTITIYK